LAWPRWGEIVPPPDFRKLGCQIQPDVGVWGVFLVEEKPLDAVLWSGLGSEEFGEDTLGATNDDDAERKCWVFRSVKKGRDDFQVVILVPPAESKLSTRSSTVLDLYLVHPIYDENLWKVSLGELATKLA
jgi:hypothetical protein